ncbi:U3 small nucleolar RNA-associated protein 6-like protein [Hypsibius exemplaris]|uniref:U3 small nucleolar RNA-associated protein 6-like protein n=1 Tax=Hypsibius exemplaris TaxID=2072580 RepID=A0A1W0X5R4_HYPEX|nr:U3 small nucleolar RNA-associated protein 6-like protein [Hypsibius exemplaris]
MAEFVDRRMESALQELEQLVKAKICTDEEIKSIVKTLRKLEYNVGRHGKSVEDHLKYVKYEMEFLELIRERRKRLGYNFKFNEIEGSVGKRCQTRLLRAEGRHPGSMEVWDLHVELCRFLNWHPMASQVFIRMLQVHSDKPEVWIKAANFELKENGSPDTARELFMKALRWHPKNEELWREYLLAELKIASNVYARAELLGVSTADLVKGDDPIATGKLVMAVARNAMLTVPDVDFSASLYRAIHTTQISLKLPEELWKPLSEFILSEMERSHGALPAYWKRRAEFCLLPTRSTANGDTLTEYETINAEKAAFEVLDSAIEKNDSADMWQEYMEFFVDLYSESAAKSDDRLHLLKKRFEKAHEIFQMAEQKKAVGFSHLLSWSRILFARRRVQEALAVLSKAALVLPVTLDGFAKLIQCYETVSTDSGAVIPLIQRAKATLPKTDPEFWRHLISWTLQHQPSDAEAVFRDALRQTRPVVASSALLYLQWAYRESTGKGRKVYQELCKTPGAFTEPLIKWVLEEEEKRRKAPIALLRKILDQALIAHGSTSADLWIDYIQLELTYPGGDALKSSQMVWKAQRALKPEAVALFTSMYNLITADESESG